MDIGVTFDVGLSYDDSLGTYGTVYNTTTDCEFGAPIPFTLGKQDVELSLFGLVDRNRSVFIRDGLRRQYRASIGAFVEGV